MLSPLVFLFFFLFWGKSIKLLSSPISHVERNELLSRYKLKIKFLPLKLGKRKDIECWNCIGFRIVINFTLFSIPIISFFFLFSFDYRKKKNFSSKFYYFHQLFRYFCFSTCTRITLVYFLVGLVKVTVEYIRFVKFLARHDELIPHTI